MKKVLVIACVAALLLAVASVAMAGTETDWRILMRASTGTYSNANTEISVGTRTGSLDIYDSGLGRDAAYTTPQGNQATVVSYRTGDNWPSPYWRQDFMAPIAAPGVKTWDLLLWTGADWGEGAGVRLAVWSTSTYTPVAMIGGVPYEYTITVINDRTGTYEADTSWTFTPGSTGVDNAPAFFVDFSNGDLVASSAAEAPSKAIQLQLTAAPVPEPGSMLALASGLVGMAGFAIRRRRA